MRFDEINETAVDELARKLPSLTTPNYDSIDDLMKRISKHHAISGDKLHSLFVRKYGHTPDTWIKKYKNSLEEGAVNETVNSEEDVQTIKDFIHWSIKKLHIQKPYPKITLSKNTEIAQKGHHTGVHKEEDNSIWVYIGYRNLIDIFRTIFHELVHKRQSQLNMIKPGDSYPGSPIEALADMVAGKYIKIYGKEHPEIFQ